MLSDELIPVVSPWLWELLSLSPDDDASGGTNDETDAVGVITRPDVAFTKSELNEEEWLMLAALGLIEAPSVDGLKWLVRVVTGCGNVKWTDRSVRIGFRQIQFIRELLVVIAVVLVSEMACEAHCAAENSCVLASIRTEADPARFCRW